MTDTVDEQGTALGALKDRLAQVRRSLYIDLAVPRILPPVVVRFQPVKQSRAEALTREAALDKSPDSTTTLHGRLLADSCLGIWMLDDHDRPVSVIDGHPVDPATDELPTFSSTAFIEVLGAESRQAAVRALYATDGDLIGASVVLQEWSGEVAERLEAAEDSALSGGPRAGA